MRVNRTASLAAVLLAGILPAAAPAAGSYSENFDDGQAQNWSTVGGAWTVTGGYYTNNVSQIERTIAVYNGTTWQTGYTYSVKVFSDWEASGNQVGVVYNYKDASNYYEVLFNMPGTAVMNKVIGGTRITVASARYPSIGRDKYFDVQIVRSGTNTTLRANGSTVLSNIPQPELGAGKIGVLTQWNFGRFDSVSVTDGTATPPSSSVKYLFRSGFGPGVSLTSKYCVGDSWFRNITGSDVAGFTWPMSFWEAQTTPMLQSVIPCAQDYDAYLNIAIKSVAGPTGSTSRALSGNVLHWHGGPDPKVEARAGLSFAFKGTPTAGYYIRRYLKYPSNLLTKMGTYGWFVQNEYKTGCSAPVNARFLVNWQKDGKGAVFYRAASDTYNNCWDDLYTKWEYTCYPSSGNCPAMPVGVWFYDEFYVRYPANGVGGVVKYAINKQKVFDFTARSGEPLPSMPNRIKITPGYMNVSNMEILVDDLEMLPEPPCGTFPCGPPAHTAE